MSRLILLLGLGFVALAIAQQHLQGANENFSERALVELGGRKYFFDNESITTWHEAKERCRILVLFLASVETPEENQLIVDYIMSTAGPANYWLSGNDYDRERGDFYWATGKAVNYTDYHEGLPNLSNLGSHYLGYWWKNNTLKWVDFYTTDYPVHAICEQME